MRDRSRTARTQFSHAARVAGIAALLIALLYTAIVLTFDLIDSNHLTSQVDARLTERLSAANHHGGLIIVPRSRRDSDGGSAAVPRSPVDADTDVDNAPVIFWKVGSRGNALPLQAGTPALPPSAWSSSGQATTANLGNSAFRLMAVPSGGGYLVAGQSLAETEHVQDVLATAELIAGPILVVAVFLGALAIGLRASRPVELARRRQLEFTADASHELRTPLSVIEAELGLALGAASNPQQSSKPQKYREALEHISGESARLRRIVEDLLWLSRLDSEPPPPSDEPVDVVTLAEVCAERFSAVARARNIRLTVDKAGERDAWINAPPEWIDRLVGVLVDNACRYAGQGGAVRISVTTRGNRVSLSVDDSGPGIPEAERGRLFDRFHRATDTGSGAGLGLAIADAVAQSTGGTWHIGESTEGGAHLQVTWNGSHGRPHERAVKVSASSGGAA